MRLRASKRNIITDAAYRPVSIKECPATGKPHRKQWQTTVYFVGFRDAKRRELESMARAAGWQVRTGFSTSLDVLIAGPLAGSVQLSKADSMEIDTISEFDFKKEVQKITI